MSNIYSDQSLNDTDMAIEMAMTLARVPAELRADKPVCANVAHLYSLVPSTGDLPFSAFDLLSSEITDVLLNSWRGTEGDRVSFYSLARAFVGVVGEDNVTYGVHVLSAYQTLLADGLLTDTRPQRIAESDDVVHAVVGNERSKFDYKPISGFLGGTTRTDYRTAEYVLPALSVLYAAAVIGTHRDMDPQDAVELAHLPGATGFYHVYNVVYGTREVTVPNVRAWQFTLAPLVLALAAVVFVEGANDEVDRIIDEVESGIFTSGFASERPDLHFEAMRERAVSMIEVHRSRGEDSDSE